MNKINSAGMYSIVVFCSFICNAGLTNAHNWYAMTGMLHAIANTPPIIK